MTINYRNIIIKLVIISFCVFVSCKAVKVNDTLNNDITIEKKVDSILLLMTLDEKIGQMSQVRHSDNNTEENIKTKFLGSIIHTQGKLPGQTAKDWQNKFIELQKIALSTRLGIPLMFAVDAVHGQNTYEGATIFPHNIGVGATRNIDLVQKAATITALESQACGFNWLFSPCIAIPYNERWGRVYEAFSESADVTSEMAKASIKGHQGNLKNSNTVAATAKHYFGDGSTDFGVEGGNTSVNNEEISSRLLKPYRAAIKEGVGAIMVSFNSFKGVAMHAHKAFIIDTLKEGMGFEGLVVSDWKGYSRFGGNDIINAGVDVVMAVDGDLDIFQKGLKKGINTGDVKIERVNDAVKRILRLKLKLGLFEKPFPDTSLTKQIGKKEHRDIARQIVRESLVLLKNNDNTLPLDRASKKIVVVGEHADNTGLQSGGWTINWQGIHTNYKGGTTILDGIEKITKGEVFYDKDATNIQKDADVAIVVVGEKPYAEFFGDIGHESNTLKLSLTENHQEYINKYSKTDAKVIVILISGRPKLVTAQIDQSDAFIAAWLPGSEGDGIAEVLFGDYDFKGKLPHSWPKSKNDFEGKYGPNFWDKSITPLFPFGYGLNYKMNLNEN